MPINKLRGRPLSDPTLPFFQLYENGQLSLEDFVNGIADIYGSQHVKLVDKNGNAIDETNPLPAGNSLIAGTSINNQALPAANNDILGTDIGPTNSPSYFRIYVCLAVSGVLSVRRRVGGVNIVEQLNHGVNLTANAAYVFDVEWRAGDNINFRYSVTGGNILTLRVDEIGGA